jgi:hypothetical protein
VKALLHMDPKSQDVVGVWLGPDDYAYALDHQSDQKLGEDTMSKRQEPDWDVWCEYLAERRPVSAWWSQEDAKPDEAAASILTRLTSK